MSRRHKSRPLPNDLIGFIAIPRVGHGEVHRDRFTVGCLRDFYSHLLLGHDRADRFLPCRWAAHFADVSNRSECPELLLPAADFRNQHVHVFRSGIAPTALQRAEQQGRLAVIQRLPKDAKVLGT